ncbi:MAG: amidase [Rubripirellula sp.]
MRLDEVTIASLQSKMASGEANATQVVTEYLRRVSEIDQAGPSLRSVVELSPDAISDAEQRDRQREQGHLQGALHGIPLLIKDSIDTADRTQTMGGSLALAGNYAEQDAFAVGRLRDAGAVILGKTNMSEWGYMRSTRACSGWSSRGGQTRNPYVLDRSPLGSSSGSAVAVAANLCMGAVGAEVDGSIVRPASSNGIVGLKPTVGLLSRSGVIGVASPQDTVGPMARTVRDVAVLLSHMTGEDPKDPVTHHEIARREYDYAARLEGAALEGVRLGVAREHFGFHEGTDAVIEEALGVLRELGAVIVDPVRASRLPMFGPEELTLFRYELKGKLNQYLADHPKIGVRNLDQLIEFNRANATSVMPFFQQELFEQVQRTGGLDESEYLKAKSECVRLSRTEGIDLAMREHTLDAIVAPTEGTPAWCIDPVVGDHLVGGCSSPAAVAGYPHITVPAGFVHGLPVGLSLFGLPYQEENLLRYAYAFEQATHVRRPPTYLTSVNIDGV